MTALVLPLRLLLWTLLPGGQHGTVVCDGVVHAQEQHVLLATAVITVQVDLLLPQTIVLKVVVEIGNDSIGPLAATVALINEVVDLPGDALHAHSMHTFLGTKKYKGPGCMGKEGRCTCWA